MDDVVTRADAIIERIAYNAARETPGIDYGDIVQEIRIALWRDTDALAGLSEGEFPRVVSYRASRVANAYCQRERFYWQHQTAEWIYTPREVRAILEEFYGDPAGWEDAPKRSEGYSQTLSGDGVAIVLMDMDAAIERLSEPEQSILIRRFVCGETLDAQGRKAVQRAVDKLTGFLNDHVSESFDSLTHDGPGSRHAVSNASARARQANYYEGQG